MNCPAGVFSVNSDDPAVLNQRDKTNEDHCVLNLLSLNAQCLRNKYGLLELLCSDKNPDFIAITEHWLGSEEIDSAHLLGYQLVSSYCRPNHGHGGTSIYVRDNLVDYAVNLERYVGQSVEFTFECSAISFKKTTILLCVYRSQMGDVNAFIAALSDIVGGIISRGCSTLILCGDFNIDSLVKSPDRTILFDVFNSYNLTSLINEPTRVACRADGVMSASGLDYLVTNIQKANITSCDNFYPGFSDHHAQLLSWATVSESAELKPTKVTYLSQRITESNISGFKRLFTSDSYHFPYLFHCLNIENYRREADLVFSTFWNHLQWCFSTAFPLVKTTKPISNQLTHPFRFSPALRAKLDDLRDLGFICKTYHSEDLDLLYKRNRCEINRLIDGEKSQYCTNIISNSSNKARTTWQLIKSSKNSARKLELEHGGCLVHDSAELVKLFGDHFSTVVSSKLQDHFGDSLSQHCTTSKNCVAESLFVAPVVAEEVQSIIQSLPEKCAAGYDNLSTYFIKRCSDVLSQALANIFNLSISSGRFPSFLKTATVIPVPKKSNKHEIDNYRPISLLSTVSKIFEKLFMAGLGPFLDKHCIIGHFQHGFRKGHSTETALVNLVQHVNSAADNNNYVYLISFDLSRAFDTLHPAFVSEKIARFGIRGSINDWILSFLTGRTFKIRVGSSYSELYNTDLGAPQGSVLGPIIFNLYINDLPEHLSEGEIFAYADDITVVVSDLDADGVCRRMNRVMDQFRLWCKHNRLIINFDKTVIMKFRSRLHKNVHLAHNITFNCNDKVPFLGTVLDCDFTWQYHIDKVASKLNSSFYAISSLKCKFGRDSLLTAYYGIFYPHLSYAILVWGLSSYASRLFLLQKRVIRLIFDLKRRVSCADTFKANNILTLACIYLYKSLVYVHLNRSHLETRADIHVYNTRNSNLLCLSQHNHSYFQKSPLYSSIKLYNLLPQDFRQLADIKKFKSKLRSFLGRHAFYDVSDFVGEVSKLADELVT